MKIRELLESAPRDKTRKDHNGNFLGFDPDRKVWVVIPRYDGIGMIRSGDLANGVLKHGSKYPEFSPSASPKPQMPTTGKSKVGSWIDDLSRSNKSAWDREIDDIKRNLYKKLI